MSTWRRASRRGIRCRKIRQVVNEALIGTDAEFEALYTDFGRPRLRRERLIRGDLIQILFSVRSSSS